MYQRRGKRVLAVDLDPQSNLTSVFLDEDDLAYLWKEVEPTFSHQRGLFPGIQLQSPGTIAEAVSPTIEGTGDVELMRPTRITDGLWLLPGDLELSRFEDDLSKSWGLTFMGDPKALRATTAFYRIIQAARREVEPDLTLIDIGPNLGAINRAALLSSDTILMPLAAELSSLRGLRNLGPTLRQWRVKWRGLVVPQAPEGIEVHGGQRAAPWVM